MADLYIGTQNSDSQSSSSLDCVENMRTQTVGDCEEEVALDSDDERTQTTKVASVMKVFSSDEAKRRVGTGLKSGNKFKDSFSEEHQNTVPFDATTALKNLSIETQLENLDVDTEVLDFSDCVENMRTHTLGDCEEEVVLDSDDERIQRTKVVNFMKELSSDETRRGVGAGALDLEKSRLSPSELDKYSVAGYLRSGVNSVYADSEQAPCFAGHSMTNERINSRISSIHADTHSQKQLVVKDNGTSRVEDQFLVDATVQDHDSWNCNGKISIFKDEIKNGDMVIKIPNGDTHGGKMISSSNCELTDGRRDTLLLSFDQELARLSYIESQEPGESSQVNALDFVERYLSFNNVNLSREVASENANTGKSPPVFSAKGPRNLARRANLRTTVAESGTFEWDENQSDSGEGFFSSKKEKLMLDYKSHGPRSVTKLLSVGNMKVLKQDLDVQCKEMGPNNSDSSLIEHNLNEIGEAVQVSEMELERNFVKELDEQFDAELSRQQLDTGIEKDVPDMFDVGLDTQMAAEAMEALLYAPPPHCSADYACQHPQNRPDDSPEGAMKNKASRHCSFPKSTCSDLGVITKQSKRAKRCANKSFGNISSSLQKHTKSREEPDLELPIADKRKMGRSLTENPSNCRIPANVKESSCGKSSKLIDQRKEEGPLERDKVKEVDKNLRSSISVEHNTVGKEQSKGKYKNFSSISHKSIGKQESQGKCRNFSPIAHRTRHCSSVKILKRTEDPTNSSEERMNDVMEVGVLKKSRKSSILNADLFQVLGPSGGRPKLDFSTSVESTNSKVSQPELNVDVAVTASHLKLDAWNYSRGKRKRRYVPGLLNGVSDLCSPCAVVGEKGNDHTIESNKNSELNSKITCFSFDMKRRARTSVYTRRRYSLEERCEKSMLRQNFDEQNSAVVISSDSALMNKINIPTDPDRDMDSCHFAKIDDVNSTSSADDAEKNIKLDGLSNGNGKASLPKGQSLVIKGFIEASPIYKGDEIYKKPWKRNLSRSPLMKELIRLGITDSLPDFTSKDLRRRRNMANVSVLFSQNLDDNIMKQQKKILARLGISIASSCSDATHFIADRFVRTRNMLEAIALGKPVVTHLWLEGCGQASCFLDEKNYILRDTKKEQEIGFTMPVSLARAIKCPLLKDQRVLITPNIKPGKELIAGLVKAVHGQAVDVIQRAAIKDDIIPDNLLILSCEQDYAMCVPFLELGVAVFSSELLLNGIVIQKLEYERHQLFTNLVWRNSPGKYPRKDGDQSLPVARQR